MRRAALLGLLVVLAVPVTGCKTTGSSGRWSNGWWVRPVHVEGPESKHIVGLRYRAGDLGRGWSEASAPPGDFAYYNSSLGATVYADTSCGKRYDDAPLTVLSNHLTMGFEDVEIVAQTELELSGRAALERIATGGLDGVDVGLASSVVKKGPCVFDLILVSAPSSFEAALRDYRRFRDGFDAEFDR